ncbi:acyl CoA:acetate/3-ketoacid CoA transferase [Xenophilus arseniciresistens]|uniref:Acyl CoA:acetate/3-ketoacid CoA transferase n=1 Tax=Xenophilus arseniciresistens TaxID=1283306 RepID=A0AAE3SZB5_9BURK|nr:CoA-transferase [Xenophilus arseniciresistens]MDA7416914.1 acyl CoA:acetate/3-ketoacid CoA transferase [Xenophilus arseniciresistens]
MIRDKITTAAEAVALIRDGDMVSCSGFVGIGTPEALLAALERRFLETAAPRDLGLIFAAAPGDGAQRGLNRLAHEGLVHRAVGGHWALVPQLSRLALEGRIEAYNLPLGIISNLYRDAAARRAGTLTKVGLGTFVDPRQGGGQINAITVEPLVKLQSIDDEEWLFYKAPRIDVALIRGTTADPAGNVTMEREALLLDAQAAAMAARNANGLVIVQVERIAAAGSLDPRRVVVPGVLVDCVVLAEPQTHQQTYATSYNAAFSSEVRVPVDRIAAAPLDERKLIARRCAFELPLGGVVNLGIGMPEMVAAVAAEERVLDHLTLTAEPGVIGGMPQGGLDFGAAVNTQALLHQNQLFDFYDGGGLDLACLGMAEVDGQGNVNVSRFGPRLAGAGGFINISQNARRLVFAGTFTAGGLKVSVEDGKVRITEEGRQRKFVSKVEQITFSGAHAAGRGQPVLYVTERCVFSLAPGGGLRLDEVAPGIDVERDILRLMDFRPIMGELKPMDARLLRPKPMQLRSLLGDLELSDRLSYEPQRNILFANYEGLAIREPADIDSIRRVFEALCSGIGRKVNLVANYDGFRLDETLSDAYFEMVQDLESRFYESARRYTTSAFMRAKLGAALASRDVAAHVLEKQSEALEFLRGRREGAEPPAEARPARAG